MRVQLLQTVLLGSALSTASAHQLPPVGPLGPVEARSATLLKSVTLVRSLHNGNVLVHDAKGRRVVLLNSVLGFLKLVADGTDTTQVAYTMKIGGLIPWPGDSTLFVNPGRLAMLVIDDHGRIARDIALPSHVGEACFIGGPAGAPSVDVRGAYRLPNAAGEPAGSPLDGSAAARGSGGGRLGPVASV